MQIVANYSQVLLVSYKSPCNDILGLIWIVAMLHVTNNLNISYVMVCVHGRVVIM
jgi:hypothetical protein